MFLTIVFLFMHHFLPCKKRFPTFLGIHIVFLTHVLLSGCLQRFCFTKNKTVCHFCTSQFYNSSTILVRVSALLVKVHSSLQCYGRDIYVNTCQFAF